MRITNAILGFFAAVLIGYLLVIGKAFFVPLVISIVIWFVIYTLASEYERIRVGSWKIPHWLANLLSMITIGIVLFLAFDLIKRNINDIIEKGPEYQAKFQSMIESAYETFGISNQIEMKEIFTNIDIPAIISAIAGMVSSIAGYAGVIVIYVLFLILEQKTFKKKLHALSTDKKNYSEVKGTIKHINDSIKTYVKIKTILSILTGLCSYAVLKLVGVDFAAFWALLIFVLNYIPTVGSIIAVIFPILLTLIQFPTWAPFIIVSISLTAIQMAIGNILEPKWMGQTLNLSPLVIVIMLTIWGYIWGITGMFLCVPIMVIINNILGKFPSTRAIAIMLSEEGKVES